MDFEKVRKKLKKQKGLGLYEPEEIKYLEKPIGKAVFIGPKEEPIKKQKSTPFDRVICDICGTEFTRGNRSKHNKTRHHRDFLVFNDKIRKIMLDDQKNKD